jgi:hypothetical protein
VLAWTKITLACGEELSVARTSAPTQLLNRCLEHDWAIGAGIRVKTILFLVQFRLTIDRY